MSALRLTVIMLLAAACGSQARHTDGPPQDGASGTDDAGTYSVDSITGASPYGQLPPQDSDGDGIADMSDSCPAEPEDLDSFKDDDGCPDLDNDEDKILDTNDDCPNEPETYNGQDDLDGCPDESKVFVHACPTIDIPEVLHYKSGDPPIKDEWKPVLDAVASVIIQNPQILRVEVAAHTDQQGLAQHNLQISKEKAEAVMAYLVDKGVKSEILSAAGYGEACPMNYGASQKSFKTNKRVEFKLLETAKGCTNVPFTCQEAVDQGLVPQEDQKYLPGAAYCGAP
jgi:OOP family OmpA-OmpF porin